MRKFIFCLMALAIAGVFPGGAAQAQSLNNRNGYLSGYVGSQKWFSDFTQSTLLHARQRQMAGQRADGKQAIPVETVDRERGYFRIPTDTKRHVPTGGYQSPRNDVRFGTPALPSGYRPPVSDNQFHRPSSGYQSPVSDGRYISPTSGR